MFKQMYLRKQIKKDSIKIREDNNLVIYKTKGIDDYRGSILLFEVTDIELQKRLYQVFKNVNLQNRYKWCGYSLEIINYFVRFKKVKWFACNLMPCYAFHMEIDETFAKIALRLVFAENMLQSGFKLNENLFNPLHYDMNSAEFLGCLEKTENKEEIENSKALLIQYLHYSMLKEEKEEFFGFFNNFVESGPIYKLNDFPYDYAIFKICYNYYKNKSIPFSISRELEIARYEKHFNEHYTLVVMQENLNLEIKKETDEYIIYSNGFKICKKNSSSFGEYLKSIHLKSKLNSASKFPINDDQYYLIDFCTDEYIGYQMEFGDFKDWHSVLDISIDSQRKLFEYIEKINQVCSLYNENYNNEYESNHVGKSLFEIEKTLLYQKGSIMYTIRYCIFSNPDIEDFYRLSITDSSLLKEQVTLIFFKLFDKYINQKYGKLSSKKDFLAINDIRYLPPRLVNEFIKYCLSDEFDLGIATIELICFLECNRATFDENTLKDKRFDAGSSTSVKDFVFDFELDKDIVLEKNTNTILSDGRRLVVFNRSKDYSNYYHKVEYPRIEKIRFNVGHIFDSNVLPIHTTKIVNSKRLNSDGFYNICGYITEPINGTQMSLNMLTSLNNRDLLKVVGYLFTKFEQYYIDLKHIIMTDDFKFYIDYLASDFDVIPQAAPTVISFGNNVLDIDINSDSRKVFTISFIFKMFKRMFVEGYNPNAFVGIDFSVENFSKKSFLELAESMTEYCSEHEIFFKPGLKLCPVCEKTKANLREVMIQGKSLVFEDSIAWHYRLGHGNQIFKQYKNPVQNIEEISITVNKAIQYRLLKEEKLDDIFNPTILFDFEYNLFQDCFCPVKKVLNDNNQLVGYIYDNVSFVSDGSEAPELCMDLTDVNILKNLPRIKSLIRLILQVKKMISGGYGFLKNPFTHVFLNLSHKKQVQILNIEFLAYGINNKEQTEKWTYDYVCNVLEADDSINIDCNNIGKDLDSLLAKLRGFASTFTKYCSIHKRYYQNSFSFCPICIKPGTEITDVTVHKESDFGKVFKQINEGGEAIIYSYVNDAVIKIFKSEKINYDLKMVVLHRIINKSRALEKENSQNHKFKFIYPKRLVKKAEENMVIGYIMEKVENAYPISNLRDKIEVEKIGFTNQDIFEVLITIGEGIETLHKEGIFVGDLNGRNILFDNKKNVYFLDFDGMGVDEISPEFCTDEYIDPVSKKNQNITQKDDWYSFAVQVFYYLTYTHPFNGIYYEEENGKKVKLDVLEKMEKRISLLGNHGMKPPEIARSWDWMTPELKTAFLNIFEGDLRESIVPYLRNQYDILFLNESAENFSSIYRVNQRFIAKEVKHFNTEIAYVVNSIAAVSKKDIIEIITDEVKNIHKEISFIDINPAYCNDKVKVIDDVKVSDDGNYAYIIFNSSILVIMDLQKKNLIYKVCASSISNLIVNGSTCYFKYYLEDNGNVKSKDLIGYKTKKINILEDSTAKEEVFEIGGEELYCFKAMFNTKFVLIKKMGKSDAIYCNSEVFSKIKYNTGSEVRDYKILYDDITKIWVVINNLGKGVIIYQTGKGDIIEELSDYVNNENLKNIEFYKGNLYIPNDDYICIFSVLTKKMKKMSCTKVITSNSILCNMKSLGFSVITDCCYYNVRKG